MAALLNLLSPVFQTTKNYEQVLYRLAFFVFWEVYVISFYLRDISQVDAMFFGWVKNLPLFAAIEQTFPLANTLNLLGAVTALAVALITRVVKLHDFISDVLGIRRRFDCYYILFPLATMVGELLTSTQKAAVISARSDLMRKVFYRYASSRVDAPLVDKHEIEQALDAWSWFWVCVEAVIIFTCTGLIAHFFHAHKLGIRLLIIAGSLVLLAAVLFSRVGKYTRVEILAIATDPTAANDVRSVFNAL
jgi:hypothetical protein